MNNSYIESITPFQSSIFLTKIDDYIFNKTESYIMNKFNNIKEENNRKLQIYNLENKKELYTLTNFIKQSLSKVFDHLKVKNDSIEINNMWASYSKEMYYHSRHIHPNSFFSGIIYIKASENSSPTSFYNPATENAMVQPDFREDYEYVPELSTTYDLYSKVGNMVLFPSNLGHSVQHNNFDKEERVTLAFTAIPKGKVTTLTQNITL